MNILRDKDINMNYKEELLKEIEDLRVNYLQGNRRRRRELLREITSRRSNSEIIKEFREEDEKFEKKVKDKMLSDLSSWILGPEGFFHRVNGRLKVIDEGTDHNPIPNQKIHFHNRNYRNEIVNAFINEIKQNPQDWKIRRVRKEEVVLNGSIFNYGSHQAVEHKSGRKHFKPDFNQIVSFSPEEWAEIENALNGKKQNNDGHNPDDDKKWETSDKYQTFSREQLIKKIEWLKSELQKLKGKMNIETSQGKLEKQLQKAETALKSLQPTKTSDNPSKLKDKMPIIIISIVGLVTLLGGLIVYKVRKNKIKRY